MLEVVLNMPKVQSRTAVDWRLTCAATADRI
jgi:hypothetical protein